MTAQALAGVLESAPDCPQMYVSEKNLHELHELVERRRSMWKLPLATRADHFAQQTYVSDCQKCCEWLPDHRLMFDPRASKAALGLASPCSIPAYCQAREKLWSHVAESTLTLQLSPSLPAWHVLQQPPAQPSAVAKFDPLCMH